jgi:hypothetical protein
MLTVKSHERNALRIKESVNLGRRQLRKLVAKIPAQGIGFHPRPSRVLFLMDEVVLKHDFSLLFGFQQCPSNIP